MSAQPAPHLRLVNAETGEFVPSQKLDELNALVAKFKGDLKNAEKDLRAKRRQNAELVRDKARERLEHPQREFVKRVAMSWWQVCRPEDFNGRRRINPMTPDRFDAIAHLAEMEEVRLVDGKRTRCWKYEAEHFKAAIAGAAFDPYTPILKNGKPDPQNDLEQICRSVSRFERFILKCPYPVVPIVPARPRPGVRAAGEAAAKTTGPAAVVGTGVAPSRFVGSGSPARA